MFDNDYEEYFYSEDPQEIENEKKKKSALMSHFPKMLGTVDQTKYVLRSSSNKAKENGHQLMQGEVPGEPKFNAPIKSPVNFGNNENAFNFGAKESESANSMQAKGFPSHKVNNNALNITTVTNNEPSNTKKSDKTDISEVFGKQDNLTFSDDCFKPNNKHAGSENDSVWDKNKAIDFSMQGLNKKEDLSCGVDSLMQNNDNSKSKVKYRGILPKYDYTQKINELKQQLPQGVQDLLENSGTEIGVLDSLHIVNEKGEYSKPHGIYTSNKIRLDSKHVNLETLLAECIHAIQDNLGMTGSGTSNLEFQEHVLKDLYFSYQLHKTNSLKYFKGLSLCADSSYQYFVTDVFDNNGVLNLNNFILGISSYFDKFQENYSKSNSYQQLGKKDFNYKWSYFFDILGIQYK